MRSNTTLQGALRDKAAQPLSSLEVSIMSIGYFYDIPVYRLPEERYYRECNEYIENVLYPKDSPFNEAMRAKEAANPDNNIAIRGHLRRSYGGCWQFNEIIGYIRLQLLGSQLCGAYVAVRKKRVVRTRTKIFEHHTWALAPEFEECLSC